MTITRMTFSTGRICSREATSKRVGTLIKMFILEVTVVLYFIKILSGCRNFYRLRMTSLTSTNVFTISCLSIEPPPRPGKFSSTALVQSLAKSLLHYSSTIRLFVAYSRTIRTIRRLFADYSSTIRGLFVLLSTIRGLFVDYSYYSSTIRTIRFTILVLSIAYFRSISELRLNTHRQWPQDEVSC
jgi:hypothetical protein